ncbi:hypothetical protein [Desulfogranum japonicum]|uniref:hypothetical protein n=1 Tax=Desulfogranum japonicum TaxID=231447 RepID=UPI00048E390D|nr:hypothetical protein [Desulfogranum japonicum]
MNIQETKQASSRQVIKGQTSNPAGSFDKVLSSTFALQKKASGQQQKLPAQIEIGTITKQTPTVSQLLLQNRDFKDIAWKILGNSSNQDKDYTAISPGTRIFLNPESRELSWGEAEQEQTLPVHNSTGLAAGVNTESAAEVTATSKAEKTISLGFITDSTPTVSHLLHRDTRFSGQTWKILGQEVNGNKPFHSVQKGSEIFLNPVTLEVSWHNTTRTTPAEVTTQKTTYPIHNSTSRKITTDSVPAADLSQAVQPYLGTSYKEINCYELLVNGLKKLDIPYGGPNGLYSKLTSMALDRGMAANAYLNGEGIVEVAGSTVLSKKYTNNTNWHNNASELYRELKPLLHNGQILSFSTQTKGHTGIISSQKDRWTFINSGRLDNAVNKPGLTRGVGEEVLEDEIRNWFKLAHRNGESLRITLGELNQNKLRAVANIERLPDNQI